MKIHMVDGVRVQRIACAVPEQQFTLEEYAPHLFDEKSAKRMARGTGFSKLRIALEDMTTADFCAHAAERVLMGVGREAVGALVFVTQTPDEVLPATSHMLQTRLGLSEDLFCLDVNEGCAGYVSGLYAASLICKNMQAPVLLLAGETPSKITHPQDRATRSIFGDAGTATLLAPGEGTMPFTFQSFGRRRDAIILRNRLCRKSQPAEDEYDGYVYLNGGTIMDFSLEEVPDAIRGMLQALQLKTEDIDLYACHQANRLILRALADKLGVPREKMPFTSGEIGNESSASIPLVLSSVYEGGTDLQCVLCAGFGVGLAISLALIDFSQTSFLGVDEV